MTRHGSHRFVCVERGEVAYISKILVAVDETESALRAAEFVSEFFTGDDVDILAINVAREPVTTLPPVPHGGLFAWRWSPMPLYERSETAEEQDVRVSRAERIVSQQAPVTSRAVSGRPSWWTSTSAIVSPSFTARR